MKLELGARQQSRRRRIRSFVDEHLAGHAADFDAEEELPSRVVKSLAAAGYLGSHVPTALGGRGFEPLSYGLVHEEIGRVCSSTRSLLTVHDMVCEVLVRLGTAAQREQWLPDLVAGRQIGAFALTEPEVGSDAGAITTTAIPDGDTYVLRGEKTWISFAQIADVFLVLARIGGEDGEIGGLLVPSATEGLRVTPINGMHGLRASMLGRIELDECRVPSTSRVGSPRMPAGLVAAAALQRGRFGVAWGCLGIAEAAAEAAYGRASNRQQFGKPIADHQLVRRMLTDMRVEVRAARLLCYEAAAIAQHRPHQATESTLMAKYYASRVATRVAGDALQIHGALGASRQRPVERFLRDARMMEIIEGSTQIQQIMIPKYGRTYYETPRSSD